MPPRRVEFSRHALERLELHGLDAFEVAEMVLELHVQRRRNPGAADWPIRRGRVVVAYNWPDRDDETTGYVVTVWRE